MLTVWKYRVEAMDYFTIQMPAVHRVLTVQEQVEGVASMWVLVDPNSAPVAVRFRLAGTGHNIVDESLSELLYIGTFQLISGLLVFHLFEIRS